MKFDLDQTSVTLKKASFLPLKDAVGSTVAVLWGAVWLTQEGDSRDYELRAGESLVIRARGVTLVYALADAAVSVLEPCNEQVQPTVESAVVDGSAPGRVDRPRYVSAQELEAYVRRAKQLRSLYVGALLGRFGRAIAMTVAAAGEGAFRLWRGMRTSATSK